MLLISAVLLSKPMFFSQTEVNSVYYIPFPTNTHQEVVRLDVAMEDVFGMEILDSRDGLIGDEEDSLERELSVAVIEQIFERWAEKLVDEHKVFTLLSEPEDVRDSYSAGEGFVLVSFVLESLIIFPLVSKLHGDLVARLKVGSCQGKRRSSAVAGNIHTRVDHSESPLADLAIKTKLLIDEYVLIPVSIGAMRQGRESCLHFGSSILERKMSLIGTRCLFARNGREKLVRARLTPCHLPRAAPNTVARDKWIAAV
jgi:hypothetical protein